MNIKITIPRHNTKLMVKYLIRIFWLFIRVVKQNCGGTNYMNHFRSLRYLFLDNFLINPSWATEATSSPFWLKNWPRQKPRPPDALGLSIDRKSTRLNSSHVRISYAVFC